MSTARTWHRLPTPDIRAEQFTGGNVEELWEAFAPYGVEGIYGPTEKNPDYLVLTTIQGDEAKCRIGDWVIAEEAPGRFYPCEHATFIDRYGEGPTP